MNDRNRIDVHRLVPVHIREVWRHEAYDFSRWLAENLDRLSEALGVELERIATEHPVGRYSLDILARLPGGEGSGELVVVENQLEQSDHDHLGKCLTYAAGVGASTVVWITPSLNPEHRAAMEWLNQNTHDGIRFFVVEPRAVRIADSPPALVLDVVVRPNDWQKAQRERATAASVKLETFEEFLDEFRDSGREDLVPVLEEIKKWTDDHGAARHSLSKTAWYPEWPHPQRAVWPGGFYCTPTTAHRRGRFMVHFGDLARRAPFDRLEMRRQLRDLLLRIPGVRTTDLPDDRLSKYPTFSLELLVPVEGRSAFLEAIAWFAEQVRGHEGGGTRGTASVA